MKFANITIDRLKAPATGRAAYFDDLLPGFGLRITANGARSWIVMYRPKAGAFLGKRRQTLGHYPLMGIAEARQAALAVLRRVAAGGDPAAESKAEAEAEAAAEPTWTFDAVAAEFIRQYAKPRKRSWAEDERIFRVYCSPEWGGREIASITRGDVDKLVDHIAGRAPLMANRTLACVRKLFNWATTKPRFGLESSPVVRISPPSPEVSRDRWLDEREIVELWAAAEGLGYPFGAFVRMLLLTAQRRDEVATMRWDQLDLGKGLWTIPRESMKAGREHVVPLVPAVVDLLQALPRFTGPYVFTTTNGARPISGFSRAKLRLDAAMTAARAEAGLPTLRPWRFHDLRRTATTLMGGLRIARSTRKLILAHAEHDVTAVYDLHDYIDEMTEALERWAGWLASVTGPAAPDNIVPLGNRSRSR